jgi:hypothetical protein
MIDPSYKRGPACAFIAKPTANNATVAIMIDLFNNTLVLLHLVSDCLDQPRPRRLPDPSGVARYAEPETFLNHSPSEL